MITPSKASSNLSHRISDSDAKDAVLKLQKIMDMFEKYGVMRQFRCSECFAHSGDVMEYVGRIVYGGFKYSLTASNSIATP